MQTSLTQVRRICCPIAPLKPAFKIFIAGEDEAAFFQARNVQNQVKSLSGNQFEISRVFWNFALFRHKELRDHAVLEAAQSEMIVLSLGDAGDLPPHVKSWVESWPIRSTAGQAALVTLFGSELGATPEQQPRLVWLREMAESRGLDFFCNQNDWERLDFARVALPLLEHRAAPPAYFYSADIPWPRGGLNE